MKTYTTADLQKHFSISIREIANAIQTGKLPRTNQTLNDCIFTDDEVSAAFPMLANAPFRYYNAVTAAMEFNVSEIMIRRAIKNGTLKTRSINSEDMFTENDFRTAFDGKSMQEDWVDNVVQSVVEKPVKVEPTLSQAIGYEVRSGVPTSLNIDEIVRLYDVSEAKLRAAVSEGLIPHVVDFRRHFIVNIGDFLKVFPNVTRRLQDTIDLTGLSRITVIARNFNISTTTIRKLILDGKLVGYKVDGTIEQSPKYQFRYIKLTELLTVYPHLELRQYVKPIIMDGGEYLTLTDMSKRVETAIAEPVASNSVQIPVELIETVGSLKSELMLIREENRKLLELIDRKLSVREPVKKKTRRKRTAKVAKEEKVAEVSKVKADKKVQKGFFGRLFS